MQGNGETTTYTLLLQLDEMALMVIIIIIIIITISYMLRKANTLAVITSNPPIEASESKS